MTIRGLKSRLSRLEKKRRAAQKKANTPTKVEWQMARLRHRRRRSRTVRHQIFGGDALSDHDRKMLENDTPERLAKDRDIIERGDPFYGPTKEERASRAEPFLRKFRTMAEEAEQRAAREV